MTKSRFDYLMYAFIFIIIGIVFYFFLLKDLIKKEEDIHLSFSGDNLVISLGKEYQLNYFNNSNKDIHDQISFINSNNNIIQLDNNGQFKALNKGHVKVSLMYNGNVYDNINIYVIEEDIPTSFVVLPEDIIIEENNIELFKDEEKMIKYSVIPEKAFNNVVLTSNDEKVIKIVNNKIKAIGSGKSTINITSINGITKSINVQVNVKEVKVQGISVSNNSFDLGVGETKKIDFIINPSDATNKNVFLSSNNSNVSVNNNGEVTGISKGDCVVTITTEDGNFSANVNIKVRTAIDDPTISAPKNGVNKACKSSNSLDTNFNDCFVTSHHLSLQGLSGQDATINMLVGETRSIRVNLASECGKLNRWTRRSADGQSNWANYVMQSFGNADNTGYTWIITAKNPGSVILSQTVQYDSVAPSGTCTGNVKSMVRINVNIR